MSARFVHTAVSRLCTQLSRRSLSSTICCRKTLKLQSTAYAGVLWDQKHDASDSVAGSQLHQTDMDEALDEIIFSDSKDEILLEENTSVQNLKKTLQNLEKGPVKHSEFEEQLKDCKRLKDLVECLHQKSENITGTMAAITLLHIHKLGSADKKNKDELDFFTVKTLQDRLQGIVKSQFDTIENETLISLINTSALDVQSNHSPVILKKMAKRIHSADLSLEQLLKLFQIMNKDHVTHDESHIVDMFRLAEQDKDNYILYEVSKQVFAKCWWKLNVGEMVAIIKLLENRVLPIDMNMVSLIADWLSQLNARIRVQDFLLIINNLQRFRHRSETFSRFLSKYVTTCGVQIDTHTLTVIVRYIVSLNIYLPGVLETAANHFIKYGHTYSNGQLSIILKSFGYMDHNPTKSVEFFNKVENLLLVKFIDFEADQILDILCHFIYLKRYPKRFFHLLYNPMFLSKIEAIEPESMKQKAKRRFVQIDATFEALNTQNSNCVFIGPWKESAMLGITTDEHYTSYLLSKLMFSLFGRPDEYYEMDSSVSYVKPIVMYLKAGELLHTSDKHEATKRLALLWIPEDAYLSMSNRFRGVFVWKKWILLKSGYDVQLVSSRILNERKYKLSCTQDSDIQVTTRKTFLSLLSDHITNL